MKTIWGVTRLVVVRSMLRYAHRMSAGTLYLQYQRETLERLLAI